MAAAKHGGHGKRGWKKLHLGVDRSGVMAAHALTEATVDEATTAIELIQRVDRCVASVTGDAAYDSIVFYDAACARRATVVVPPIRTATVSRRRPRSSTRDRTIQKSRSIDVNSTPLAGGVPKSSRSSMLIWSADGKWIASDSNRKAHRDLYLKASNGAGGEQLLLETPQDKSAYSWSGDGRFFLYGSQDPKSGYDLWVLPLLGDRKPFAFVNASFDERQGSFFPDGRWIAYASNESGRFETFNFCENIDVG
jgi:Tol biopolymer transport system component